MLLYRNGKLETWYLISDLLVKISHLPSNPTQPEQISEFAHMTESTDFVMKDFSPDFGKQSLELISWEQNLFRVWFRVDF